MKTSKEAIGIDSENKEVETTAREAIVTLLSPSLERFSSFLLCVKKTGIRESLGCEKLYGLIFRNPMPTTKLNRNGKLR